MRCFAVLAAVCAAGLAAGQQCTLDDAEKFDCYPWDVANQTVCAAHGCCWEITSDPGVPWCFYPLMAAPSQAQCDAITEPSRIDCHPEVNASQPTCAARGCCWELPPGEEQVEGVAYCFFPHTDGYTASAPTPSPVNGGGFSATLSLGSQTGPYRNDIATLALDVAYVSQQTLRFTISDPATERFVPPVPLQPAPATPPPFTDYEVTTTQAPAPFGIVVTRRSTGAVLFDSTVQTSGVVNNGLIFEDQYLEMSTVLPAPSGPDGGIHIYGLGEHIVPMQLPFNGSTGQIYTLLARDQGTPVHNAEGNTNLYASMPFYMVLDPKTGDAFGVWLFNSNGMDVLLQPNSLTYRVTGGILDFYLFTGPTPAAVVQQYLAVVGTAHMPPKWALGFHLCRWGYGSLVNTQAIWQSMLDAQLPQDAQWNDIDYMDAYKDFTTDPEKYPIDDFAQWVNLLNTQYGQKYMMIIDPGISSTQQAGTYAPWDQGVAQQVFINDTNGNILIGKVWPGETGFPDFFAPNTTSWWTAQLEAFHSQLKWSGLWIDMNEPSNFCNGQCEEPRSLPAPTPAAVAQFLADKHNAAASPSYPRSSTGAFPGDPKYPPYLPGRLGGATLLETNTVAMSAQQYAGLHYNLHNLYGWSEGRATKIAAEKITGKRAMIISRSTFASSGTYNGHWLGDNEATWDDLYYSIPGVLSFNMLGIPLVGADTCGFAGNATTPELCTRWMQLGAFVYGFYRNHNTIGKQEQAPSVFAEPFKSYMRTALNNRLTLVPYLYTLFYQAHAYGDTVTRPLFFEFPRDANVAALDTQVMLGPALMISPVLQQGAVNKTAYFPAATWYDWYSGAQITLPIPGWNSIPAPLSMIPVHIRGGYVVPTQDPNMTTVFSALNPFHLTIALSNGVASGELYLDDGDSLNTYEMGQYTLLTYAVTAFPGGTTGELLGTLQKNKFSPAGSASLQSVRVFGVSTFNSGNATVNDQPAQFVYDGYNKVLTVNFNVPINADVSVQWTSS